jgi:hypothetical protein
MVFSLYFDGAAIRAPYFFAIHLRIVYGIGAAGAGGAVVVVFDEGFELGVGLFLAFFVYAQSDEALADEEPVSEGGDLGGGVHIGGIGFDLPEVKQVGNTGFVEILFRHFEGVDDALEGQVAGWGAFMHHYRPLNALEEAAAYVIPSASHTSARLPEDSRYRSAISRSLMSFRPIHQSYVKLRVRFHLTNDPIGQRIE